MRKYKLITDQGYSELEKGQEHYENFVAADLRVKELVELYPEDWVEVTGQPIPTLHKDTDLGYFVGLAMGSLLNMISTKEGAKIYFEISGANNPELVHKLVEEHLCMFSIELAQELIKQLDEQKLK